MSLADLRDPRMKLLSLVSKLFAAHNRKVILVNHTGMAARIVKMWVGYKDELTTV